MLKLIMLNLPANVNTTVNVDDGDVFARRMRRNPTPKISFRNRVLEAEHDRLNRCTAQSSDLDSESAQSNLPVNHRHRWRDSLNKYSGEFKLKVDIFFFDGHLPIKYHLEWEQAVQSFFEYMEIPHCNMDNHKDLADVLSEIFKASSSIRLLSLYVPCKIPEAVGDLIHLRYLRVSYLHTASNRLPRSICNLYHMYFVIYVSPIWYFPDDFLSRDMNNLFNLRYVELPWHQLPQMHWIGKLHPLQKLNKFFVKNEAGYRINELKHVNELRQLRIYQLENVKDVEETCNAKFCDKGSLTKLSLHWGDNTGYRNSVHSNLDEEVFDNLQPHNNLKKLTINAYMGTRSAIWMNNVNFISNLVCIHLEGCLEWQTLPPFGQLHFLKSLNLCNMPKVKSIDSRFHRNDKDFAFPSLEVLYIQNLEALEEWFDAATAANDSLFPCLTMLHLEDCPNLQVLPSLPPKLQKLYMINIRWKGFSWLKDANHFYIEDRVKFPGDFTNIYWQRKSKTTKNGQFIQSLFRICDPAELLLVPWRSITSVKDLTIWLNDKLVSFPVETEKWFLQVSSSLCSLAFMELKSLQSLPSFLKSLSSLEILNLTNIPLLKSLPDLPSSLKELYLSKLESLQCLPSLSNMSSLKSLSLINLESLECLPSSLLTFYSLKYLMLSSIPYLKSLPNLPSSLIEVRLCKLKSLQCLPSLSKVSSLKLLSLNEITLLTSLPDLPSSLERLSIINIESLECLPSSLSTFSSLDNLNLSSIPYLKSLPNLPSSMKELCLCELKSLQCLSPSLNISSLKHLSLEGIPLLTSLPDIPSSLENLFIINLESLECLPSSLSTFASLRNLNLSSIPYLKSLPNLPSLKELFIKNLELWECLPSSFSTFSSLKILYLSSIPLLKSFSDLPPFLHELHLCTLHNLNCLPCLSSLSFLHKLAINNIPQLRELPVLPSSLRLLTIRNCHPELKERYEKPSGSDLQKFAHIPAVLVM